MSHYIGNIDNLVKYIYIYLFYFFCKEEDREEESL